MNLKLMLHMKPTKLYSQNLLDYVSKRMVSKAFWKIQVQTPSLWKYITDSEVPQILNTGQHPGK